MISSVTFSVLSFGQSEGLHPQRNQLDLQLRRHQEHILRFAVEAPSISCCEQLVMGHQTWVSLIWEEEDVRQGQSHSQCLQVIVFGYCVLSVFSPSGLTGTSLADRQRRHVSSQLDDVEKILLLETKIQRLKLIKKSLNSEQIRIFFPSKQTLFHPFAMNVCVQMDYVPMTFEWN